MRVAIAEDDEASCKLLQAYLKTYSEKTGVVFEIDCFPDGMKLVNAYKPVYDLLLLDIEMPLLDGMSAARRIRNGYPSVLGSMFRRKKQELSISSVATRCSLVSKSGFTPKVKNWL